MPERMKADGGAELFLKLLELIPGFIKRIAGEPSFPRDITPARFRVIFVIHKKGAIKMNEMARLLSVTPGTLTVMIDRLYQEGFVERYGDPEDRRSIIVKLTPAGENLLHSCRRELLGHLEFFFSKIPPQEREELVSHLKGTIDLLEKYLSS